jgi:prepilin-type N-terminal cleavage/methylation domain-containing protein
MKASRAFTLIEILIVVAILALLAAVGTIDFQHARVRAKVARSLSDMGTIAAALEHYSVDHGAYPVAADGDLLLDRPLAALCSPVVYLTCIPEDPFSPAPMDFNSEIFMEGFQYKDRNSTSRGMPADTYGYVWRSNPERQYYLHSAGPNRAWDVTPFRTYDPSNGTESPGDIIRFGPM